ncbi:hypothetical protein BDK92_3327 [Micromonospora pisi]|uniref:ATP/GTP-binding protein n=1 Tax=Micromonospora pisi TaxID=589240 RepID=A0A495JJ78_9ACTN|nr:hypothetical protein [Micromonospora pisi]RKR88993.1 hypothetical protein BDK92_3327 [Micromonospora pisi]
MLSRRTGPGRRLLTVGAVATLTLALGLTGSASADPGAVCPPTQTNCYVWDGDDGNPGGGDDDPGSGGDGGTARKCTRNGQPMRCYDELLGWFSQADGCYYKLQEPQPDGVPEGMKSYLQSCGDGGVGGQVPIDLAEPPPGFGDAPDPADLAAQALAEIRLLPVEVGVAPKPGDKPGLVGLPIWLWVQDHGLNYWGPIPNSASDRGVTVTISAEVEKIVWKMGNGAQITCAGRGETGWGREFNPDTDANTEPPCGYRSGYPKPTEPGKPYKISAVTHWKVTWSGGGESGVITTTRGSDEAAIEIDELQVVTR